MRHGLSCLVSFVCVAGGVACGSNDRSSSASTAANGTGEATPALPNPSPSATSPNVGATPSDRNEQSPALGGVVSSGTPAIETPPVACSKSTIQAGDSSETLEHDGQTRQFLVHVPRSYDGTAAVPLVLDIHGLTSNAQQQAALSGWRGKADDEGFIVVHPQGLNASWNAGALCCGSSQASGVDDEGFLRAIVGQLESEACIDPKRVYATGLSNGGGMSHLLACRAADVFAATAPVSMGNGTIPCQPVRPISVVMTRGTQDPLVPYNGGFFPSAQQDLDDWSQLNGCTGDVTTSPDGLCETHRNCDSGVQVTLCSVNAGHVLYQNSDALSVPDTVWEVFQRQVLP